MELAIEEPEDDSQPITDFEDGKARKRLEYTAKRKAQGDNLCTPIRQTFATDSATLSLSCLSIPALSSHLRSPTLLSSYAHVPTLSSRLPMPALSSPLLLALISFLMSAPSSLPVLALSPLILALLLRFVLGLALTRLIFSGLKTFKQAFSDKFLGRQSTSPSSVEPHCLVPTLDPLSEKSDCKRIYDTAFVNSRPLVENHATKEVDLSFGEFRCSALVKLNDL